VIERHEEADAAGGETDDAAVAQVELHQGPWLPWRRGVRSG
jgi:hypothetical protein